MKTVITQNKKQLTSREFFRSPAKVAMIIRRGEHIVVTNRGELVFEVVPVHHRVGKKLADFADLQFSKSGDGDLSKRVDEIAYGA